MAQIGKPQDPALDQVTVSGSHKQILFNDHFQNFQNI